MTTSASPNATRAALAALRGTLRPSRAVARPDLVFFLSLPERERRRRLHARSDARTGEEERLARGDAFRERVVDGYAALGAISVDADRPVAEVVEAILRHVRA